MDNTPDAQRSVRTPGKNQKIILKSLKTRSPLSLNYFSSIRNAVINLESRGLVEVRGEQVFLLPLGERLLEEWQNPNRNEPKPSPLVEARKQNRLEKSNQLLELYKQGFNRQQIGDEYGISRERVRQILNINPAFHEYLKENEEAEAAAEQEKKEIAKQEFYSKSLAALYPERVAELWDYEKNGALKPEDISAGTVLQYVWFRCPVDGHSWKKKPNDITTSWTRNGTSGCPMCAGKKKKAEKQPVLAGVYPELIRQYWDYEKNSELKLDPEKLTLASNRKAYFKCPHDGNEWEASIASTVNQQWSKDNAGCRVCNGTSERRHGEWKRQEPIAVEFPDEVAKYWFYKANNELELDPMKLTIGSSKEAFLSALLMVMSG